MASIAFADRRAFSGRRRDEFVEERMKPVNAKREAEYQIDTADTVIKELATSRYTDTDKIEKLKDVASVLKRFNNGKPRRHFGGCNGCNPWRNWDYSVRGEGDF